MTLYDFGKYFSHLMAALIVHSHNHRFRGGDNMGTRSSDKESRHVSFLFSLFRLDPGHISKFYIFWSATMQCSHACTCWFNSSIPTKLSSQIRNLWYNFARFPRETYLSNFHYRPLYARYIIFCEFYLHIVRYYTLTNDWSFSAVSFMLWSPFVTHQSLRCMPYYSDVS